MTADTAPTSDRLTVYVPTGLRRAVKIAAALDGVSMSEWVTRAFNRALPAFDFPPGTTTSKPTSRTRTHAENTTPCTR